VDFRIGMRSGKSYLVKERSRFIRMGDEGRDVQYGVNAIFNQNIRNFTPKSQEYIAFIREADEEGRESLRKLYESSRREQERLRYFWENESIGLGNYEYIRNVGQIPEYELKQQIPLDEKRMDRFFALAESSHVAYEERKGSAKMKCILLFSVKNPRINLQIAPAVDDRGIFQGVEATAAMPELIRGKSGIYYIEETAWNRMEPDFVSALEPFLALTKKGEISFRVGRRQLQSFYYTVLPDLGEYLDIEYRNEDIIQEYLLPDVRFIFYLDVEHGETTCRALARYGEQTFSLKETDGQRHSFRDTFRENEVLDVVRTYFSETEPSLRNAEPMDASQKERMSADSVIPAEFAAEGVESSSKQDVIDGDYDSSANRDVTAGDGSGLFYCRKDGEALYRLLADGVRELMKLGEVQSSDSFRKLRLIERPKIRFAVSLHSGLLDLYISSDEISREELLEVLQSYRQKKNFHRLRNGDFLSLESDSYAMLQDLFETMQISPKEFVSGNMHLPAYRALYLDKMLEGQEAVYTERDTHFKQLIRDFGTVQNADYPIPESLRPVLRGYQKTGYRWLRTLKDRRFGGIRAGAEGLGRTLQVIAVLLAWKEEGEADARFVKGKPKSDGKNAGAVAPKPDVFEITAAEESETTAVISKIDTSEITLPEDIKTGDVLNREPLAVGRAPSLIICPASLVYNWGEEFGRYAPSLSVCYVTGTQAERREKIRSARQWDVLITSYDLLKRDIDAYEGITFDCEVIDEALYIKNHETAAAKAGKLICAETRYALTGTPIENRLSELWSIFD
ncbi:MAG: SNF2 helicase associated domain-containing protein, partial [Lachnospiraceae bacterium]|nr:SNF2 helicase associated domain-containing protein [Lachnospiraceae bacterium]